MPSWTAPPIIVAEALVAVTDPLLTALGLPLVTSALGVAASLAGSLAPAEADIPGPSWLLPEQRPSFRRAAAALQRHNGAILADPVGSGKTYVALAVASVCNRARPTACLVPATLIRQWELAAAKVGVPVRVGSHEQASRGRLPESTSGVVIVDESHHYRNHRTRRYSHVARWLVGRPALLVTATPVVNRLEDLAHQLRLAVRDDALAVDGIPSLQSLLGSGCAVPALGRLVLETELVAPSRPRKASIISPPTPGECASCAAAAAGLQRLRLSTNPSVSTLVRGVMARAAGSSPAALAAGLRRYRRLLLHARDALAAGRTMDRAELRRLTSDLGDQLVWWELFPENAGTTGLELADLNDLDLLIAQAESAARQPDEKLGRLRALLSDGRVSVVFTCSRSTVRYIREHLAHLALAWCTGERAGIGNTTLARQDVLGWFKNDQSGGPGPAHLIVTDVAAEGLDLQRAARVVHYDLPWTPMRLGQREGRALRLGSRHQEVEVVRFRPPPALEHLLRMEATLTRKSKLPASAGLGKGGRTIWRWRAELSAHFGGTHRIPGAVGVKSEEAGILAGFACYPTRAPATCLSAWVGWIGRGGSWSESPEVIAGKLLSIADADAVPITEEQLRCGIGLMMAPIRDRIAAIRGRHWISLKPATSVRRAALQLQSLITDAARKRDSARLRILEGALDFISRGHTAGEAMLIERLAEAGGAIERPCTWPPEREKWDDIEVRLTGLIWFGQQGLWAGLLRP